MNATLVRNILSLMILGFVLVIGFQATALEATASSFSFAGPCEHACLLAKADCYDWCDDVFWNCWQQSRSGEDEQECLDQRDDCYGVCNDDYDGCILDCES